MMADYRLKCPSCGLSMQDKWRFCSCGWGRTVRGSKALLAEAREIPGVKELSHEMGTAGDISEQAAHAAAEWLAGEPVRCGHGTRGFCVYCEQQRAAGAAAFLDEFRPLTGKTIWHSNPRRPAPMALTDAHVKALEAAIRREGYRIMVEIGSSDPVITLERREWNDPE